MKKKYIALIAWQFVLFIKIIFTMGENTLGQPSNRSRWWGISNQTNYRLKRGGEQQLLL